MIINKVSVEVYGKTSEQIYTWFINLDQEKYSLWHPDHSNYHIRNSKEGYIGSEIKYEQKVDDVSFWWKVIECGKNRIVYRAKFIYPIYLVISFQDFQDHVVVTQEMRLGIKLRIIDDIFDLFVRKFIFTESVEKRLVDHTTQEFKNLETII